MTAKKLWENCTDEFDKGDIARKYGLCRKCGDKLTGKEKGISLSLISNKNLHACIRPVPFSYSNKKPVAPWLTNTS